MILVSETLTYSQNQGSMSFSECFLLFICDSSTEMYSMPADKIRELKKNSCFIKAQQYLHSPQVDHNDEVMKKQNGEKLIRTRLPLNTVKLKPITSLSRTHKLLLLLKSLFLLIISRLHFYCESYHH